MAKRGEHGQDPTMELSASQLVVSKPPAAAGPATPVNDRSAWGQLVVGADDFAPAPKKPKARWRLGRIAAVGAMVAAIGGGIAYLTTREDSATTRTTSGPVATPAPMATAPTGTQPPGAPTAIVVAAPTSADAAVVAVGVDAGVATVAPATVDAGSGTDAPTTPAKLTKKTVGGKKKPAVTKKPAPKKKQH